MSKEQFIEIYKEHINRDGSDALLAWLEKSDFFIAPASTKYHGAFEGGLCEHSLNVYERLKDVCASEFVFHGQFWPEDENVANSIALCALLHDVCKAEFYKVDYRNAKDTNGVWQKVPYYTVDDQLPYGHGEKSVYIVSGFLKLTREEAMSIRWHMGGFDDSVKGGSYALSEAFKKYPLALLLHIADMQATYLDEREDKKL